MTRPQNAGFFRSLAFAAAAVMTISLAAGERAGATSLMTPGTSPAKAAGDGLIRIRGGHGGGHGGFHGGGFHGFHGGGGWHGGHGWHGGGVRFAHFHHHRIFYGGYYPDYYYPSYHRHCRVIWTHYGPRRICGYRHWHHWHHWHRWYHHRHYW